MDDVNHAHEPAPAGRRQLAVALSLSLTVLVVEAAGALLTGSLALLVDAAHTLTDAAGLVMALIASVLIGRPATPSHSWGYRRAEVISAAAQSLVLLGVGVYAVVEGVGRLSHPAEIPPTALLIFGIVGLAANLTSVLVLARGRAASLNLRAAFLEVVNDAFGSVAVIAAAIVIATTGWTAIDTVLGLVIAALILPRSLRILFASIRILMETAPAGLDPEVIRAHLLAQPHVVDVHDLHVTEIGTGLPVLTAHIELDERCFTDGHLAWHLDEIRECLHEHFDVSIDHETLQLEPARYGRGEHLPHS